jgi:Uma2 family endonuclease
MLTLEPQVLEIEAETPSCLWLTEDEFVAWCDEDTKAEWVNGEVIMHSPASFKHVELEGFLLTVVKLFAIQRDLGVVCGPEFQIRLTTPRRRRTPDILFVAKERRDIIQPTHVEGAPDLVMEIVSLESLPRDWRDKYWEYETAGVQEYWVIDPLAPHAEAYALGEDKRYARIAEQDEAIHSTVLPGFYLKPAWLWQDPLPNPLEVLKELGVL